MDPLRRIFWVDHRQVTPVAEKTYNDLLENRSPAEFAKYANQRLKTADISVDPGRLAPQGVVKTEFRYTAFDSQGRLDLADVSSYMSLKTQAMDQGRLDDLQSEFQKRHCWSPSPMEFKVIMTLALKPEADHRPVPIPENNLLPYDKTNPKVDSIGKVIGSFPGLRVVGNNLALDRWSVHFDVIDPGGLISIIFLLEGLKLEMVQDLNPLIYSPDKDMRYTLSVPQNRDPQKISLWLLHLFQKRSQYKRRL